MRNTKHILILDSIPYISDSKLATQNILACLTKDNIKLTVLTHDKHAWQAPGRQTQIIYEPLLLTQKSSGIGYYLRHLILFLNMIWVRIKFGKIDLTVGASSPNHDLAIYLYQLLFNNQVMQLIHAPITPSKTAGYCLREADSIFYIGCALDSINLTLKSIDYSADELKGQGTKIKPFLNGLPTNNWPSPVIDYQQPKLLWAETRLKQEELATLTSALESCSFMTRPETHICYNARKQTQVKNSQTPIEIPNVYWHESPDHLDEIRRHTNIFISTSHKNSFGLATLEAMAAGLCIVIPKDGSYWDHQLIEGKHCIKYLPCNPQDLRHQISAVIKHPQLIEKLGLSAQKIAQHYRANTLYHTIAQTIEAG